MQMARVLVIDSASASKSGIGGEWSSEVIRIEARDNHLFAAVGKALRHVHECRPHEVGFVDSHHLHARVEAVGDVGRGIHDYWSACRTSACETISLLE